jgi:hypothetical protein
VFWKCKDAYFSGNFFDWGLRIADCGLGIADWGISKDHFHSNSCATLFINKTIRFNRIVILLNLFHLPSKKIPVGKHNCYIIN